MGNAGNVKLGVCDVTFDGLPLGYTRGFVKMGFTIESIEKRVDQLDIPLDEIVTKQALKVTVPMAEQSFDIFSRLIPGATMVIEAATGKKKVSLSGDTNFPLSALAGPLVLTPRGGDANDRVTLHNAIPVVNWDVTYDKENVRVYTVEFRASRAENGKWVTFGDASAPDPTP